MRPVTGQAILAEAQVDSCGIMVVMLSLLFGWMIAMPTTDEIGGWREAA